MHFLGLSFLICKVGIPDSFIWQIVAGCLYLLNEDCVPISSGCVKFSVLGMDVLVMDPTFLGPFPSSDNTEATGAITW